MNNNNAIGQSWDDFEKEFYTGEEITKSDLRVALMGERIQVGNEKELTLGQKVAIVPNKQE